MLKEFRIKNFKSIKDEQIFTMEACPRSIVSEYYKEHVLEIGNEKLLKLSSFYGPNGGGKSNLIKAFMILRSIVIGVPLYADFGCDKSYLSSLYCDNKEITFEIFI